MAERLPADRGWRTYRCDPPEVWRGCAAPCSLRRRHRARINSDGHRESGVAHKESRERRVGRVSAKLPALPACSVAGVYHAPMSNWRVALLLRGMGRRDPAVLKTATRQRWRVVGSTPTSSSRFALVVGIGIHDGLKPRCPRGLESSNLSRLANMVSIF